MDAPDDGAASSAAVEAAASDAAFDLNALESTRFGLELFGAGILLFLCGMGLGLGSFTVEGRAPSWKIVDLVTDGLSLFGYLLIIAGTALSHPAPKGPLPALLRLGVIGLYALAVAIQAYDYAGDPARHSDAFKRFAEVFWPVTKLLPPVLAWFLWGYARRSGLTSVATLWLATAIVWSVVAVAVQMLGIYWVGRFYMAIGPIVFFAAYLTARDLWMDGVIRGTRKMIAERRGRRTEQFL